MISGPAQVWAVGRWAPPALAPATQTAGSERRSCASDPLPTLHLRAAHSEGSRNMNDWGVSEQRRRWVPSEQAQSDGWLEAAAAVEELEALALGEPAFAFASRAHTHSKSERDRPVRRTTTTISLNSQKAEGRGEGRGRGCIRAEESSEGGAKWGAPKAVG